MKHVYIKSLFTFARGRLPQICAALLISTIARANANAEVDTIRHLLKAHSAAELNQHIAHQQKTERMRLVCDSQLKTGKIPGACFKVLSLESQFDTDEATITPSRLPWLEELCSKRAKTSKDWRELDDASTSVELPRNCRKAAELRLDDLHYAAQTENPAELFKHRFAGRSSEAIVRE